MFKNFEFDKYECFMPLFTSLDLSAGVSNNIFSEFNIPSGRNFSLNSYPNKSPFDILYVCDENRFHVLPGPYYSNEYQSALPGITQSTNDFAIFVIENAEFIDGASQQKVYDLYDIYYQNGVQYCSQSFYQDFIENGIVTKSYNSSEINITGATITGNDKNIEIYSTQGVNIGVDTYIGEGSSFFIGISNCPIE